MKFISQNYGWIIGCSLLSFVFYKALDQDIQNLNYKKQFLTECDTIAPHAVDLDAAKVIRDVYSCPDGVLYIRNKK